MYKFIFPGCNAPTLKKLTDAFTTELKSTGNQISLKFIITCTNAQFEHVLSLLKLPSNLLDIKYHISSYS